MAFDHNALPMMVREAWQQKPIDWKFVAQRCLNLGINHPNKLADFVFYLTYPKREGAQIEASDQQAIELSKYCRAQVKDFIGVQGSLRRTGLTFRPRPQKTGFSATPNGKMCGRPAAMRLSPERKFLPSARKRKNLRRPNG